MKTNNKTKLTGRVIFKGDPGYEAAVKAKYDPHNVFNNPQSIPPARGL